MRSVTLFRAVAIGLAALILAGCGQGGAEDGPVILRVGDQFQVLQSDLRAAGEDQPEGYRIVWANFIGGPSVIAAQTGGSIDIGWMAETPLVFAQSAGSPVKVVAAYQSLAEAGSAHALATGANSPVRSIADLRGRSVAYMPGTVAQYVALRVLEREGLTPDDIRPAQLPDLSPGPLISGDIDAAVLIEPILSQALQAGQVRVLAWGGPPLTPELNYLVASDTALADPRREAAIRDLVARHARAIRWRRENPQPAAEVLAQRFGIPTETARRIVDRTPSAYTPIGQPVIDLQQEESDFFLRHGVIRARVDARRLFDDRFNDVIARVETAPDAAP